MNHTNHILYHSIKNPKSILLLIFILTFFNHLLTLKKNDENMFILKKGIMKPTNIKNGIFSHNNSNSEIILIYPRILHPKKRNKIIKNTNNYLSKGNDVLLKNTCAHKKKYPHIYSKYRKSPLYSRKLPNITADLEKQNEIKNSFLHAWKGYKKYSWGHDIFHPSSKTYTDFLNGGLTIIDSISTLIIMGLDDEIELSKRYIEKYFNPQGEWSLFEFIIRYIGGLISAYYLSNDDFYKKMAIKLGEAIFPIISKKDGFYSSRFYLQKIHDEFKASTNYSTKFMGLFHEKFKNLDDDNFILAEVGSFQMEFLALTEFTGDIKFANISLNVYRELWKNKKLKGLLSNTIGSGYDSYYEYIIKTYLQTRGSFPELLHQYISFTSDLHKKLVMRFKKFVCIGTKTRYFLRPSVEHFTTFAAGMLALGSVKANKNATDDFNLATDLVNSYIWLQTRFNSGLVPDYVLFDFNSKKSPSKSEEKNDKKDDDENGFKNIEIAILTNQYKLRPETVESIYWLWKFTGDRLYRDAAWKIFVSLNKSCRVRDGFTSVANVEKKEPDKLDEMDSYFLSETLKYLYLTFSDSELLSPFDWVFNTEGHPFRMVKEETVAEIAELVKQLGEDQNSSENNFRSDVDLRLGSNNKNKKVKQVKKRGIIKGPFN